MQCAGSARSAAILARMADRSTHAAPAIRLEGLSKRFPKGDTLAVSAINLDVHEGEFFSLLGPSGSGKTTTLRMINELPVVNVVALVLVLVSIIPVWIAQRISGGEATRITR